MNEPGRPPVLLIRGLTVGCSSSSGRAAVPLVEGASLAIGAGEAVALVGPSGAGKSTLARAAMGAVAAGLQVKSGQVLFQEHDLLALPAFEVRRLRGRRITFVAQSAAAAFNPMMSLGSQVLEPVRDCPEVVGMRARMHDLLAELGIEDAPRLLSRRPHQVSGGQLQRMMIAMALLPQPELVVLDEPTSALDAVNRAHLLVHLAAVFERQGTAALLVSHDHDAVGRIANRVIRMQAGRLHPAGAFQPPAEPQGRPGRMQAPGSGTLLRLAGVSAGYGAGQPALQEVSFGLAPAEKLGVIGVSGAGKSTLVKVVCGLMGVTRGSLRLNERPLLPDHRKRSPGQRRAIQWVSQNADLSLNPTQTVETIVGRPLALFSGLRRGALRGPVEVLLRDLDLDPALLESRPERISGGQKQRVALARALAAAPDLLVCDEVTSALDTDTARHLLNLLLAHQRRHGMALLVITHDLRMALQLCDRIVVLEQGMVAETGTPRALLEHPGHPATAALVEAMGD